IPASVTPAPQPPRSSSFSAVQLDAHVDLPSFPTRRSSDLLELSHLKKSFGEKTVVQDLSLCLERGELLCILGSSGCGKTTTLNMIGGFLAPDSGRVLLDGEDITAITPERRPVTIVFQSYGLFPHMTVLQNVLYGLKFQRIRRSDAREKGLRYLDMVGLSDYAGAYIHEISGGQQQR